MPGITMTGKNLIILYLLLSAGGLVSPAFAQESELNTETRTLPAGEGKTPQTRVLEAGAKLLQSKAPLKRFDIYLVGFHPMKDSPNDQMEAHHYCHQINEDFVQCALFDSNDKNASLNGIEYIISE